jgi:hypothetical protein
MITGTTGGRPYVVHGGTDGTGGSRARPTGWEQAPIVGIRRGGGPIVNVREDRERATTRGVVGVDGSAGSGAALAWALYAAAAQRSVVLVVTAFPADIAWYDDCEADSRVEAIRWEAARRTQELVAEALADLAVAGVQAPSIRVAVVPAELAERLLDHSRGAELVVGNPGYGGVPRLLEGSVARHCVLSASCRVVLVLVHPSPAVQARVAVLGRSQS